MTVRGLLGGLEPCLTTARVSPINDVLRSARILVVDDEPTNLTLMRRLLSKLGYTNVTLTASPEDVPSLCQENEPDLLILDLQMPRLDGFSLLELLRPWTEAEVGLPVIVVTADATPASCERALRAGAQDFITKPFNHPELELRVRNLLTTRLAQLELVRHRRSLEARVTARTKELHAAKLDAIERLALAGEYRDDATHEHAERVGRTAALIALELGVPADVAARIRRAAPLHDIGKIGVPDCILLKPEPLTADEYERMKEHTEIGFEILASSASELLTTAAVIALHHHERWDGLGYPHALRGEMIPLAARIVSVADAFDAITHERPYKLAATVAEGVAAIVAGSGSQFDPSVVEAFSTLDHDALMSSTVHRADPSWRRIRRVT